MVDNPKERIYEIVKEYLYTHTQSIEKVDLNESALMDIINITLTKINIKYLVILKFFITFVL